MYTLHTLLSRLYKLKTKFAPVLAFLLGGDAPLLLLRTLLLLSRVLVLHGRAPLRNLGRQGEHAMLLLHNRVQVGHPVQVHLLAGIASMCGFSTETAH